MMKHQKVARPMGSLGVYPIFSMYVRPSVCPCVCCQLAKRSSETRWDIFIATNQRVVAAKQQQRELVALTIRGSVLFYSSAI